MLSFRVDEIVCWSNTNPWNPQYRVTLTHGASGSCFHIFVGRELKEKLEQLKEAHAEAVFNLDTTASLATINPLDLPSAGKVDGLDMRYHPNDIPLLNAIASNIARADGWRAPEGFDFSKPLETGRLALDLKDGRRAEYFAAAVAALNTVAELEGR